MSDEHLTIRQLLGDAPDEARRTELAERARAENGGVSREEERHERRTEMDSNYDADRANADAAATPMNEQSAGPQRTTVDEGGAAGAGNEGGLSTADIAGMSSTATEERTQDRAGAPAGSTDRQPDRSIDRPAESSFGSGSGRPTGDSGERTNTRPPATASHSTPSSAAAAGSSSATDGGNAPLFPTSESEQLRKRWLDLQAGFVDEPRQAVQQADGLVADVIQKLAASFADERSKLEHQWDRGEDVSTEDLRVALKRYRSFFDRLLSM